MAAPKTLFNKERTTGNMWEIAAQSVGNYFTNFCLKIKYLVLEYQRNEGIKYD